MPTHGLAKLGVRAHVQYQFDHWLPAVFDPNGRMYPGAWKPADDATCAQTLQEVMAPVAAITTVQTQR